MRTVILAGGLGLRMESGRVPKALVHIGDKPLIEHVMGIYAGQGFDDFIVATGYLGAQIEKWVKTTKLPWKIQAVQTGLETRTGGRVTALANQGLIGNEPFFLTYADGMANINLRELIEVSGTTDTLITVTAVQPRSQFGIMRTIWYSDQRIGSVQYFEEKPQLQDWINGGFMFIKPGALGLFTLESDLEKDILPHLAGLGKLSAYRHEGFWKQVDNPKDVAEANEMWEKGKPWR